MTATGLSDVAIVATGVWAVGSAAASDRPPAERLAFGVGIPLCAAAAAMLQAVAGVGLLGQGSLLAVATPVAIAVLVATRRPSLVPKRVHVGALAAFAAAAALVVAPSVADPANLIRAMDNDSHWHAGWTHQLIGGASDPGGPYAGIPNAYPWLYHSLAAWLAQVLPGGVSDAFLAIQALTVIAMGCGTWLLARALGCGEAGAAWAVLIAVGGGGVGWIWQHGPAAVLALGSGLGPYHGDFVLPNAMSTGLGNLAPVVPRETALALVPLALAAALRAGSRRAALAAGGLLGLIALLGLDDAAVALVTVLALAVALRRRLLVWTLPSAAAVLAVWAAPLAVHYARYGGFHQITARDPANPSLAQALVALGVVVPLGAAGLALLGRAGADRRVLAAVAGVPLAACAAAFLTGTGHPPLGITAFVRWLRYLPLLAVALAPAAGEAAARITALAGARRWATASAAAVLAGAVGASTALAAAGIWSSPSDLGLRCDPAPALNQADEVATVTRSAGEASEIGFWLFSSTGARILYLEPHRARVRYREFPAGVPTQFDRATLERAIAAGAGPYPSVGWVVSDLPRRSLAINLRPVSACRWRGSPGLTFYRRLP